MKKEPIEKKCEKCGKDCGNDPIHTCYIPSTSTDTESLVSIVEHFSKENPCKDDITHIYVGRDYKCVRCGFESETTPEGETKLSHSFLEERLKIIDKWFGNGAEGDLTRGRFSISEVKSFLTETIKLGEERCKDSTVTRSERVRLKSALTQEIEERVRREFLKGLPPERIVHSYMKTQDEGKSTEYCNGWNDYRNKVISSFTNDKK